MSMINPLAYAMCRSTTTGSGQCGCESRGDTACLPFRRSIVAVLAAMRVPTAAMITAAAWTDGEQTAREVWRDMIDAALNDNGDPT